MARPSIKDIKGIGDFAPIFRWNVEFKQVPHGMTARTGYLNGINLRCESIDSPPKLTNQKIEVNVRGHKFFQPGAGQYNNQIQLTCVETVDNFIHTFLKEWRDLIWEVKTGVRAQVLADLMGQIVIERLDARDTPIWQYTLHGVFLEDYEPGGSLDGSSSEYLKPSMTFSYDWFEDKGLV